MYMAFFLRKSAQCAVLLCGLAVSAAAAVDEDQRTQAIRLDAASTDVDYRTNKVLFRDIVISQGDITVEADRAEATGLDFENSRWTFTGNVQIQAEERGSLRSERATVEFRDNQMATASITGSPAVFEQRRADSDQMARGRAGTIEYRVSEGTVRLSDSAWLTDGRNEISGPLLVYNIREQRVQAATQAGEKERVRITILPRQDEKQEGKP